MTTRPPQRQDTKVLTTSQSIAGFSPQPTLYDKCAFFLQVNTDSIASMLGYEKLFQPIFQVLHILGV